MSLVYRKFLLLQEAYIDEGLGGIFYPEMATKFYGVSFMDGILKLNKHYEVLPSVIIDGNGARPTQQIYFTNKGIKKLLKVNKKMRDEVNSLYEENKEEFDLPTLVDEVEWWKSQAIQPSYSKSY